jgi:hypothetical protein|tara:strand:+ start:448 stop:831 length:384 start_codon:yes stop_codon:yes gene_type:complete
MNDLFVLFGIVSMAAIALICFGTYAVYGGFKANLCDAKPGQVFNFEYMQPLHGDHKRVLARVLEPVEYRSNAKLDGMNRSSTYRRNDPDFKRTNHIVTCELHDGEIRQFYCERVKNCRKPLFGGMVA